MGGNRIFYWEPCHTIEGLLGRILFVVLGAPENFFIAVPFIKVMLTLREMMRVAEFLNAIQNRKSGHSKIQTVHFRLRFGPSHLAQHPTQKKVFS